MAEIHPKAEPFVTVYRCKAVVGDRPAFVILKRQGHLIRTVIQRVHAKQRPIHRADRKEGVAHIVFLFLIGKLPINPHRKFDAAVAVDFVKRAACGILLGGAGIFYQQISVFRSVQGFLREGYVAGTKRPVL